MIETLIEAALLVVIVVILFLQTWRASVIPLLAVPVSIPLMLSTGPGSEIRRAMGVTVFAGMIGVTLFGLVLTPVFYVALRTITRRVRRELTA